MGSERGGCPVVWDGRQVVLVLVVYFNVRTRQRSLCGLCGDCQPSAKKSLWAGFGSHTSQLNAPGGLTFGAMGRPWLLGTAGMCSESATLAGTRWGVSGGGRKTGRGRAGVGGCGGEHSRCDA
jgi:hypothetical protein